MYYIGTVTSCGKPSRKYSFTGTTRFLWIPNRGENQTNKEKNNKKQSKSPIIFNYNLRINDNAHKKYMKKITNQSAAKVQNLLKTHDSIEQQN